LRRDLVGLLVRVAAKKRLLFELDMPNAETRAGGKGN
jgi:hypothetical protein